MIDNQTFRVMSRAGREVTFSLGVGPSVNISIKHERGNGFTFVSLPVSKLKPLRELLDRYVVDGVEWKGEILATEAQRLGAIRDCQTVSEARTLIELINAYDEDN